MSEGFQLPIDPRVLLPDGWTGWIATGHRAAIPNNSSADIWHGAAATRPLPLAPMAMSVISTSAADDVGTLLGATHAGVSFIDDFGDWRASDRIPLAGLTSRPITYTPSNPLWTRGGRYTTQSGASVPASIYRVQAAEVIAAAGSTEAQPRLGASQGTITVRDTATLTVVYEHLIPLDSSSHGACFHVPRFHRGYLTRLWGGVANGTATLQIARNAGPGTAWKSRPLIEVNNSTSMILTDAATAPLPARTDMQGVINVGSNNVNTTLVMQFRLEPV